MGTDIHAVFQARKNGEWIDVQSLWDQQRHYFLFAWLANVRNGRGFAGVETHEPIKPIAKPRGLPDDFAMDGEFHLVPVDTLSPIDQKWYKEHPDWFAESMVDGQFKQWLGYHSYSWLTIDEILAAERPGMTPAVGVIDRKTYETWDGKSEPDSYCGMVSGPNIIVVEQPVVAIKLPDEVTHVRVRFMRADGLDYFIDEMKRLKAEHGDVRMVFGFDS